MFRPGVVCIVWLLVVIRETSPVCALGLELRINSEQVFNYGWIVMSDAASPREYLQ